MEIGTIVGAFIFFFIIVPTLFPKIYQRMHAAVTRWTDADEAGIAAKKEKRSDDITRQGQR